VNGRASIPCLNVSKGFVSSTAVIDEINAQASVNMFPTLFLRNSDCFMLSIPLYQLCE
jgi:hypothetical protein